MIFNSLKSRIIVSVTGIVVVSLAITSFFLGQRAKYELSDAIEESARNLMEATKNHVESQHNSINYHKSIMLDRRKIELRNNTTIAFAIVNGAYRLYKAGRLSENEAKQCAIDELQRLRYDEGTGYFWVNDTNRPYPGMVMHPTMPELDGNILDNPEFNCALGKKENLFKAFVDVCLEKEEGYVDYLWPKPVPGGLTEQQPKISYVKRFKTWDWIIGTGVYIDDIKKDVDARIKAVIEDLNETITKQKISESGYFFIFNEENIVLVHPNSAGMNGNVFINPETGGKLLEEIKSAFLNSKTSVEYLWEKPGFEKDYRFLKKTFITKFEPLGWYICSSVYIDDFEKKISNLTNTVILFSVTFLVIALIISLLVSRSVTNPLNKLIRSISKTGKDGLPVDTIPETGTTEIKVLGSTMNNMIDSISKAGAEVRGLRNYLSNIIDSMPSMLIGVDAHGKITQWNRTAERIAGVTAGTAQGKLLSDVFPRMASEMAKITESIRTREAKQERKKPRLSENGTLYEEITVYPLIVNGVEGAVIRIDDVTDKVRMEEMMIQSEKMLSVGGLAAGIAHEINNPLAGMMQSASVMLNRLGVGIDIPANRKAAEAAGTSIEAVREFMRARDIPRMLKLIDKSGRRVANIVDNMLSFARKSESLVSSYSITDLLDKTIELASADYDLKKEYDFRMIEIRKEYEENLPPVPCEGPKIQQVLLNILRNGAEAMQGMGTEKPRFIVRTRYEKKRELVCVEIEDNGPGMDEETRKRAFEPFFTTKPVGVGTGLGLSVSYFIITENHGGEMTVESRPASGAKFIIRLPLKRSAL